MRGVDDQTSRLFQRVVGLRGMNTASPKRSLPDGESPNISGVLLRARNIVPGKVGGAAAFPDAVIDEPVRLIFVYDVTTPFLVLMGDAKCWVQQSGDPVAKTPSTPFSGSTSMWDGFTMLHKGAPVAVVNNRGVNLPHYWDVNERTLAYDAGDHGDGDVPDAGDTVTGSGGSVGTIMSITTTGGAWDAEPGDAAGVLTLRYCSGDWADEDVLTFKDGETAVANGASVERDFIKISAAPSMRCAIGYLGRLLGGSVTPASIELLNRLQWSVYGDITTWTGATSGDLDLEDEGDRILRLGLLRGHQLLILRQETTYIGYPTLDPGDPIATHILAQRGIYARMSLQRLENSYIFMGKDDIYMCDATSVDPIGWKIRKELFRDATPSTLDRAWSFADKRAKTYYLVVAMNDGTDMAWIYNWEEQSWTRQDLTGYTSLAIWRKD